MKHRRWKWFIKNIMVELLAAFAVFAGIVCGLDYLYLAPQDQEWECILWHYFYEDKGKIDNLYIGSSHVYLGINPYVLDELNGQYNFNLASTALIICYGRRNAIMKLSMCMSICFIVSWS